MRCPAISRRFVGRVDKNLQREIKEEVEKISIESTQFRGQQTLRDFEDPVKLELLRTEIESRINTAVADGVGRAIADALLGNPYTTDARNRHPQLAQGIVWLLAPRERRNNILGDLSEEFILDCAEVGAFRAKLRYWRQALMSTEEFLWQDFKTLIKWMGGLSQFAYATKRLVDIVKRFLDS